jgi:hypothetical protein
MAEPVQRPWWQAKRCDNLQRHIRARGKLQRLPFNERPEGRAARIGKQGRQGEDAEHRY